MTSRFLRDARPLLLAVLGCMLPILVGCGGFFSGTPYNFASLMTCASTRLVAQSDIRWVSFTASLPTDARPDDIVSMTMALTNEAGGNPDAIIGLPSNLRLFLSFDNVLDANDYLVAEYIVNNLDVGLPKILVEDWRLPRATQPPSVPGFEDAYFPVIIPDPGAASDPNYDPFDASRPEYIGPQSITYNLIGVLDSANCIDEYDPTGMVREPATREDLRGAAPLMAGYNPADITINNQVIADTQIVIGNPNLPNLTIEFVESQPGNIPMAGSVIITDWVITNTGIGPVMPGQTFDIAVFLSENDVLNGWDVALANQTVSGPLYAGSQITERIVCSIPYQATRQNAFPGWFSALNTADGKGQPPLYQPVPTPRAPPPAGPPSVTHTVYAPIPSENNVPAYLIALVDVADEVRESVETDNLSSNNEGLNGTLAVRPAPPGGGAIDFIAVDVVAFMENGQFVIEINYDYTGTSPRTFSIGFYLSEDDGASSADYFWDRFLFTTAAAGRNRATFVGPPANVPAPLDWYVTAVLDDVLAIGETDENNNVCITIGQVRIG